MKKIADTTDMITQKITDGYKKIEDGVVNGYKKIENGAVDGFTKVTDKCVETLFAKEGESVEEAKARLAKKNQEELTMNKNDQEYLVQKIRTQYTEKEYTKLDELKKLDKKVKAPANAFAYIFGTLSALIMGSGMSLIMTDLNEMIGLADPMLPGIVIGVVGMLMAILNYPIYKGMLNSRRQKYADQIVALSDQIMAA